MRLACARHLNDLERAKKKDFAYTFDADKAARACRFIELLPHTKGKWARPVLGQTNTIRLENWQVFITCVIFGWVEKSTGLRRFTDVYICIPRKNAKSTWAAAVGLYMLVADGEYGAEVYSGATTEKQAWEVFRPARLMAKKTADLQTHFGIEIAAKGLFVEDDGSRFEPIVGNPGDGASASCAIIDEYHEHPNASQHDTMQTGMAAREQPILLVITTAGSNIAGPCFAKQEHVQKVLEGLFDDDSLFGIVYTIDEGDSWASLEAAQKANPNYGVSVLQPFIEKALRTAVQQAAKQNNYKTKHLNIWCGAAATWMNMEKWNACADPALRLEDFAGEECFEANDLSSKIDITARMRVFRRDLETTLVNAETGATSKVVQKHYYAFGHFYLPDQRAMAEDAQHYQKWVHEGLLTAMPGAEIDYAIIKADILADCARFNVRTAAFDPWGALQLQQELAQQLPADTVITIPQQTQYMSEPMKEIEAAVLAGRLHHDGGQVLNWMMSNVLARADSKGNLFPLKQQVQNKIDGAVALIMAISRAMIAVPKKKSIYSSRGLLAL